jgi:hypothetical protein
MDTKALVLFVPEACHPGFWESDALAHLPPDHGTIQRRI